MTACRVKFFEDCHGYHASSDIEGTGFISMHVEFSNDTERRKGLTRERPAVVSVWHISDVLLDDQGKYWFRNWHGVMDDFGDLVEIEVEEFPF